MTSGRQERVNVSAEPPVDEAPLATVTVAIVADDDANRHAIGHVLAKAGYRVAEAATGGAGLRLAQEAKPDAIVLDVNLPDVNGFEVCRKLKADPRTARIPVVHVSASFVRSEDRAYGLEGGADGFLTEPIDPRELVATLQSLVRARRAEERARAVADLWQATFDAIRDAVLLVGPDERVSRVNRAAASLVARDRRDLEGSSLEAYLDRVLGPGRVAPLARARATGERQTDTVEHGGRWITVTVDPIAESGRWGGAVVILADVTERRRSDEERERLVEQLAHERARFEAVLRQLPGGVAIVEAPGGHPLLRSEQLDRILGPAVAVPVPGWPISRALKTGQAIVAEEHAYRRPDGTNVVLRVSATPIHHESGPPIAVVGTYHDVTAERRAAEAFRFLSRASAELQLELGLVRTAESLARLAVPTYADWCMVDRVEADGTLRRIALVHADPALAEQATALGQYSPIPAGPIAEVVRTGRPMRHSRALLERLEPAQSALASVLGVESGLTVPLIARGRTIGALSFFSSKGGHGYGPEVLPLLEDLASRAALALDNARLYDEATNAVRTRDDFLGVASHDLRNPLGVIVTTASLLERALKADNKERLERGIDAIKRNADRMTRLIDDLLDIVRIEAGRLVLNRGVERIGALVADAHELMKPLADARSVSLVVEALPDATVSCDRERLSQVFSNLVGNAIKFTPASGSVTLGARTDGREVVFSVRDTGAGIPQDQLGKIFQRFWRARPHDRQGAGLGLSIAKGIVEAHGGRIWAESRMGAGSTFHFTVPLAP